MWEQGLAPLPHLSVKVVVLHVVIELSAMVLKYIVVALFEITNAGPSLTFDDQYFLNSF